MSDYKFEDDSSDAAEYLKALEDSEKEQQERKDKKNNKEDRIEFFTLEIGKSADFRFVQIPNNKTSLRQKVHYLGAINLKEIEVPSKVSFVTCLEQDGCLGEKCEEYIVNMKSVYDFDSPENKELFKKQCSVQPSPVLNIMGIDRRDGKVKLFQANKPTMVDILNYFNDKDEGNPAHPTEGYDFEIKRKDKKTYNLKKRKSKPLTEDELNLLTSIKDPFSFVKFKGTKEYHDRIKVKFGATQESPKSDIVLPPKEEEQEVALEIPKEEIPEDDIPF